jgi:hypothetical protein
MEKGGGDGRGKRRGRRGKGYARRSRLRRLNLGSLLGSLNSAVRIFVLLTKGREFESRSEHLEQLVEHHIYCDNKYYGSLRPHKCGFESLQ